MRKLLIATALLGGSLIVQGCAREAGGGQLSERFGQATELTFARQVAYPSPEAFIADMGKRFAAETEDTVTFAFNSAALDSTARAALDGQARWLAENAAVRMTITGHTDAVGPEAYNDRLGLRRAQAVVGYLVRRGIDKDRLIAVESAGERQLVVPTQQRERRNRRAVTEVSGFSRQFVGTGMDGRLGERLFTEYLRGATTVTRADTGDTGG